MKSKILKSGNEWAKEELKKEGRNLKELIEDIEDYENPFVGKRYFGHENCYNEIEKLRKKVLKSINKRFGVKK